MKEAKKSMLKELELLGYCYSNIHDIYKQKKLPPDIVDVMLDWLPDIYNEHLGSGDQLVRSLISADKAFDPSILINLFENNSLNDAIKWGIGHVLAVAKTKDISGWIQDQLLNQNYTFYRSSLLNSLEKKAGIKDAAELMIFLKKIFDKYAYFETYQKLFKKYADDNDIPFLEKKLLRPNFTEYLAYEEKSTFMFAENKMKNISLKFQKEISKLIQAIKARKVIHKFPN